MGSMGGELQEGGGMGGGKVELEKFSLEGKEPYILDRVRPWEGDSAFPGFKLRFAVYFYFFFFLYFPSKI